MGGRESLDDDPRSGRSLTVATPEIVTEVHDMVMGDKRVTERYITSAVGISQEIVYSSLTEDLDMKKLSAYLGTQTSDSSRVERKTVVTQTYFWNPCLGATLTPL